MIPRRTGGHSLLSGNVFCAHCGSRLNLNTSIKSACRDDPQKSVRRYLYICYGRKYKQTVCNGQTGYAVHLLDGIIDKLMRQVFTQMKAIPKEEIVNIQYQEKMVERKTMLCTVQRVRQSDGGVGNAQGRDHQIPAGRRHFYQRYFRYDGQRSEKEMHRFTETGGCGPNLI